MQDINKNNFVNQFYDIYKTKIKKHLKHTINQYIVSLGKSDNEYIYPIDILFICKKFHISCYGIDADDKLLVKYVSNNRNYKALVWRILNNDFQPIEGNEKKSIVGKLSMMHYKKAPKPKKMVYCDVCKMNHRQLLVEGIYYKECLKRWFISGKNMCMSFSAEYSEETYQKASTMMFSILKREYHGI